MIPVTGRHSFRDRNCVHSVRCGVRFQLLILGGEHILDSVAYSAIRALVKKPPRYSSEADATIHVESWFSPAAASSVQYWLVQLPES
jgi:hypothetical protein